MSDETQTQEENLKQNKFIIYKSKSALSVEM